MKKRTLKQDLMLWAKRVDRDPNWFYCISPSDRVLNFVRKEAYKANIRPLSQFRQDERVLFLLFLVAGARA